MLFRAKIGTSCPPHMDHRAIPSGMEPSAVAPGRSGLAGGSNHFVSVKALLLLALAALPCAAQVRSVKVWFNGIGCASCTESMNERVRRLRGVESVRLDTQAGTLEVQLAGQNRIRLEQIRDLIEQDGTKALRAAVRIGGELSKTNDQWMLRPPGVSWQYEI